MKKTPEFYARVCRFLELDPHDLIHTGDNWQFDYVAPAECGITAYYLDRTGDRNGEYILHDLSELEFKLI